MAEHAHTIPAPTLARRRLRRAAPGASDRRGAEILDDIPSPMIARASAAARRRPPTLSPGECLCTLPVYLSRTEDDHGSPGMLAVKRRLYRLSGAEARDQEFIHRLEAGA